MKKILGLALVAGLMSLTSCAKSYTCECTATDKATGEKDVTNWPITGKKKDAKAACTALQDGDQVTYSETCELK